MNIFYLDSNPVRCANYHNDKHVVKMILEYAQLLCSVHHLRGVPDEKLYRLTHQNHPSAVWVRSANAHYDWLYALFIALCDEYTYRYGKTHLTYQKLATRLKDCPFDDDLPFVPPPQVMPDEFKMEDTVLAYQNYYKNGKSNLLIYTKRGMPSWAQG